MASTNRLLLALVLGLAALASPYVAVVFYEQGQDGAGITAIGLGVLAASAAIGALVIPSKPSD